ncbi:MAG: class I adenylate-forming enzyme family protein [Planctomycetota bacterium]
MSIVDQFRQQARTHAQKVLVRDSSNELSYVQFAGAVALVAQVLHDRAPGQQRIGLLLPTSSAFMIAFFGTLAAGRTAVPMNYLLGPDGLDFQRRDAELQTVLTTGALTERVGSTEGQRIYLEELFTRPPDIPPAPVTPEVSPDDIAAVVYTSGTTSKPRGVMLSHRALSANAHAAAELVRVNEQSNILAVLPPFHSFALTTTVVMPAILGATVNCIEQFSPKAIAEMAAAHGADFMPGVSTMYRAMLLLRKQPELVEKARALRVVVSGGEPLPHDTAERFGELFGVPLLEGYGLTEAGPIVSVNPVHAPRPGTAGKVLSNVSVRIVDDRSDEVPKGQTGALHVKGPSVMSGYLNDPAATAEKLTDDGWLNTGDLARLDEAGYLVIEGRQSDMIISGGENINPRDIEDVLLATPGVLQAAVIGVPDPRRGEVPCAFVVCGSESPPDAETLRRACTEALAPYMVPRRFELRDELPLGPTGKVMKKVLRQEVDQ